MSDIDNKIKISLIPAAEELTVSTERAVLRLRAWIRGHMAGGCRMLSIGDACECPLCDLDRLFTFLKSASSSPAYEEVPK